MSFSSGSEWMTIPQQRERNMSSSRRVATHGRRNLENARPLPRPSTAVTARASATTGVPLRMTHRTLKRLGQSNQAPPVSPLAPQQVTLPEAIASWDSNKTVPQTWPPVKAESMAAAAAAAASSAVRDPPWYDIVRRAATPLLRPRPSTASLDPALEALARRKGIDLDGDGVVDEVEEYLMRNTHLRATGGSIAEVTAKAKVREEAGPSPFFFPARVPLTFLFPSPLPRSASSKR